MSQSSTYTSFQAANLKILTVKGPKGDPGRDGTGAPLPVTGLYPLYYDAGSGVMGIYSGAYVTPGQLTSASGALQAQINGAGVSSVNGLNGVVYLTGGQGVTITHLGQTITITATGVASGDLSAVYQALTQTGSILWGRDASISGGLEVRILQSGAANVAYTNSQVAMTGQAAILYANEVSGALQSQIANSGALYLNRITPAPQSIQSAVGFASSTDYSGNLTVYDNGSSTYLYIDAINSVNITGKVILDGTFLTYEYASGAVGVNDYRGLDFRTLGFWLESSEDGIVLQGASRTLSGDWHAQGGAHPNSLVVQSGLWATGSSLYSLITGNTGTTSVSGYITTGQADLRYYPLGTNPSGYVTVGQTGQFYPSSNPRGYAMSGDLAATGGAAVAYTNVISGILAGQIAEAAGTPVSVTGSSAMAAAMFTGRGPVSIFTSGSTVFVSGNNNDAINLSGNLSATGATLISRDNSISGGLEARLIQTGNAAVAYTTVVSGGLETRIGLTGQAAWQAAQNNAVNLSGRLVASGQLLSALQVTGSNILNVVNATGVGTVRTSLSGLIWFVSGSNADSINLSGALSQTGSALISRDDSISGGLEQRIFLTGAAAVVYINSVSGGLETRLSATGQVLAGLVNGLSGTVDSIFVHRTGNELISGNKYFSGNIGIGTINASELLTIGDLTSSPNIRLSRWAFFGQESTHLTTVIGGNIKASGSSSVVSQDTPDGYRAIRMRYDEGITFHAYQGNVSGGDLVGNERMRISTDGNVGIGTSSPTSRLHVVTESNTAAIYAKSNTYRTIEMDSNHIQGPYLTASWSGGAFADIGSELRLISTENFSSGFAIVTRGASPVSIGTSGTRRLIVMGDGSVGIGTSNPIAKLEVRGGIYASAFGNVQADGNFYLSTGLLSSNSDVNPLRLGINDSEKLRIHTNGNVGIGTASPAAKLDISGSTILGGNTTFKSGIIDTPKAISSDYSILSTDHRLYCTNLNPITLTFPSVLTNSGQQIRIKMLSTGAVYFTGVFGQKFDGSDLYTMAGQYNAVEVQAFNNHWNLW